MHRDAVRQQPRREVDGRLLLPVRVLAPDVLRRLDQRVAAGRRRELREVVQRGRDE